MKNICTIILTFLYLLIFLVNAQGKERPVPTVQHKYTNQLVEGETKINVCQFKVCKLPVTDTKATLTQIFDQ